MSRNMKEANQRFFSHVINSISAEYSDIDIPDCIRYIRLLSPKIFEKWKETQQSTKRQ